MLMSMSFLILGVGSSRWRSCQRPGIACRPGPHIGRTVDSGKVFDDPRSRDEHVNAPKCLFNVGKDLRDALLGRDVARPAPGIDGAVFGLAVRFCERGEAKSATAINAMLAPGRLTRPLDHVLARLVRLALLQVEDRHLGSSPAPTPLAQPGRLPPARPRTHDSTNVLANMLPRPRAAPVMTQTLSSMEKDERVRFWCRPCPGPTVRWPMSDGSQLCRGERSLGVSSWRDGRSRRQLGPHLGVLDADAAVGRARGGGLHLPGPSRQHARATIRQQTANDWPDRVAHTSTMCFSYPAGRSGSSSLRRTCDGLLNARMA